ncbi:MAG: sigma-70 family RNA polymerase sigma factor [Anaerolineales bacterium]|nr:sigma-70 family RNA polymerase sigma factor [Anaerolineales bacterium]
MLDENRLLEDARGGDLDAFNRLVLAHQTAVYNVSYRILGDPAAASDAAQEAFISAFKHLKDHRGGSFRAWLLRIVTNACYDSLRREKRRPAESLDDYDQDDADHPDAWERIADPQAGPEREALRAELNRAIEDCLQRLPAEFRMAAVLVDVEGHDYLEAAAAIGKPVGTVKSRVARARARLRDCLRQYGELLPAALRLSAENSK